MSASHSFTLSATVTAIFDDLLAWIEKIENTNPFGPPPEPNVVSFKVVTISQDGTGTHYAFGSFNQTEGSRELRGTASIFADTVSWSSTGFQGQPFTGQPIVANGPAVLSLSLDRKSLLLTVSQAPGQLPIWGEWIVSLPTTSGSVDENILSGKTNFGEAASAGFNKTNTVTFHTP